MSTADHLHVIVLRAFAASTIHGSRILELALRCASHEYLSNLPPEEHAKRVLRASFHAEAGAWHLVARELDH